MMSAVLAVEHLDEVCVKKAMILLCTTALIAGDGTLRRSSDVGLGVFQAVWFATASCCIWYWLALTIGAPAASALHTLYLSIASVRSATWHELIW